MALPTLEGINLVKQRTRWDARKPGVSEGLRSLWKHMEQLGNPDLYFEAFSGLDSADQVISDSACKLYALFVKKPTASTVDAWMKGSDHATVAAAAADVTAKLVGTAGGGREYVLVFHDGLKLATGLTLGCHTTVNGNTKSAAADAATGFAIIGAA